MRTETGSGLRRCHLHALILALSWAMQANPQALGPDEVRITTRVYAPQPATVYRATSELVDLGVVPRDVRGHVIAGLKAENFEVLDEGKPVALKAFSLAKRPAAQASATKAEASGATSAPPQSAETPAAQPRSILFFFDDVHTATGDLARARIAAKRFLDYGVSPGDRLAVMTSSGTVSLAYTDDVAKVKAAMGELRPHVRVPENGIMPCPRITPYQAYLIANNLDPNAFQTAMDEAAQCNGPPDVYTGGDLQSSPFGTPVPSSGNAASGAKMVAVSTVRAQAQQTWELVENATQATFDALEGAVQSLSQQPGARLLVLTSSGFLAGQMFSPEETVVDAALRAGVVIDSLDATGLYSEAPGLPLGEIPNETVVKIRPIIFHSLELGTRLGELERSMAKLSEATGGLMFHNNNDLDLGYREIDMAPEVTYLLGIAPAHDGKYHHLTVKIRQADPQFVQARPGYFAALPPGANDPVKEIDHLVASGTTMSDVPASFIVAEPKQSGGAEEVKIAVRIDASKLKFEDRNGRHLQTLAIITALLDERGNVIAGKEAFMNLALKDSSYTRFAREGISGNMSLAAKPGHYQLREIVREGVGGKFFCSTATVFVP